MKMVLPADATRSIGVRAQNLDAALSPGGLYAADPDLLFTKVLFPLLKEFGFRITFGRGGEYAYVTMKGQKEEHRLQLISVSKIKVREFGDRHVFDRHVRHGARWEEKRMQRELSKLWSASSGHRSSLLVLVCYDRRADPMKEEIGALERAVCWESHGVRMDALSWDDPHGRGFHTGIRVWSKTEEASQAPQPATGLEPGRG